MFKLNELEKIPLTYNKIMRELEEDIIVDIANRILATGEITATADWNIFRLHQLGKSKWWIRRRIRKTTKLTLLEVRRLYKETFAKEYVRDEKLYKIFGAKIVSFKDNKELQQSITAAINNCGKQLENITKASGFSVSIGGKKQYTDVHKYFANELDKSIISVQNGLSTADKETIRVVKQMCASGFQTVTYDSGVTRSVESAVRMCVMTGLTQITAQVNESNAEQLGTDKFEVSCHGNARPSHMEWQGRVWTKEQLVSVCGLGTATGLCGINCYHQYFPFIDGISERSYSDEELDKMIEDSTKTKKYNGVEYTPYEATRRMRFLERNIRKQQKQINILERLDKQTDEIQDTITIAKCKKKALSQQYVDFADKMGLPQERSRLKCEVKPG